MAIYIDTRWTGEHGIGRFATEVTSRLSSEWTPLRKDGSPSEPADYLRRPKIPVRRDDMVFSPGYNVSRGVSTQLVTVHDLIHLHDKAESSALKRLYYDRLVRPAIRRSGAVLTVSQTSADAVADWLKDPRVDIRIVGNGCSAAFTEEGPGDERARGTFLYVGNARPHKNFAVVVAALAIRPEHRLTVVSRDGEALRSMAEDAEVADRVDVRRGLTDPELAAVYRSSAGLLMPSTLEGFGLPALEAISTGSEVGYWSGCESVAEIVGDHGVAVGRASSAEEWAVAMDTLLIRSATRPSEDWLVRYSWDRVAERVDDAFSAVAAR